MVVNQLRKVNLPSTNGIRIPSLDGLRALSIVIVMASHTVAVFDPKDPHFNAGWAILSNGQIGVEIFFVISGFLITSLLLSELSDTGEISLRRFYLRRSIRILPPYYVFLAAILGARSLGWLTLSLKEWISSLLFIWNYLPSSHSWWLGHTWSLCVEEQFYLLWPLALKGLGRQGAQRLALWIVACSPLIRVLTYFTLPTFREKLTFFLSTRADALMMGCILALCATEPWFQSAWETIGHPTFVWGATVFVLILSPVLFSRFHFVYQMSVGYTLEVLCIGLVLMWVVRNPAAGFGKFLNLPIVAFAGVLSYSLYLWQQPFIRYQGSLATQLPYNLALILLLAAFSYFCVERPALSARRRLRHEAPAMETRHFQVAAGEDA